jgi:hypothetical protein
MIANQLVASRHVCKKNLAGLFILTTLFLTVPTITMGQIPGPYAGSPVVNFLRTWSPTYPVLQDSVVVISNNPNEVRQTTEYFDGFNRNIQTVTKKGNPFCRSLRTLTVEILNPTLIRNRILFIEVICPVKATHSFIL